MGGKEKRQALGEVNRYATVDWGWGVGQVYCCNLEGQKVMGRTDDSHQLGLDIKVHLCILNPRCIRSVIFIHSKLVCPFLEESDYVGESKKNAW